MGMLHEDRTREPYKLPNGRSMKSLSIVPFALEADRMIAAIAVLLNVEQFHGQLDGNVLSFVTRQSSISKFQFIIICSLALSTFE